MLHRTFLFAAAVLLSAAPAFAEASKNPLSARKGAYDLDSNHANVTFCVVHMGISPYCGRFNKVTGRLTFDTQQPEKSSVDVAIDLASVDTPSDVLDEKLRRELFTVEKTPTATFKSTKIAVTSPGEGTITGDLTFGTVTKPVTLKARFDGGQVHPMRAGSYQVGFSAGGGFKRSAFGLTGLVGGQFVSDDVDLTINVEFLSVE